MKIQMTAKVMDDNGNEVTRTIEKEAVIPDIAEYGKPEDFHTIFYRYEKPALEIRNELSAEITEAYLERAASLKNTEKSQNCELEAEIGRCRVEKGSGIMGARKPKERAYSLAFTELCLTFAGTVSVREGVSALNRVLWRTGANEVKVRTYADFCQRQGREIEEAVAMESVKALRENGFDEEGGTSLRRETPESPLQKEGSLWPDAGRLERAKEKLEFSFGLSRGRMETLTTELENPEESCYVSADEILVRRQKERRTEEYQKEKAFVKNTVIEVESTKNAAILTAGGMKTAFVTALAYLLANGLLTGKNLVFFTDGAKDLRGHIMKLFAFRKFCVILDWYHLMERCKVCLSMSFKGGKERRNQILAKLSPLLWLGDVSAAVTYLKGLNPEILRPKNRIEELQNYLEERREQIPCYALRHELGLRISSNRVEKANDIVVAQRQKHNGMSWSETGSGALAQISALFHNGGLALWLDENRLSIFPPHSAQVKI